MILIVADTGPVNYLIQIEQIDILPRLVEKVVLPAAVHHELMRDAAPDSVRTWAAHPPPWIEIRSARKTIEARQISTAAPHAILGNNSKNGDGLSPPRANRCSSGNFHRYAMTPLGDNVLASKSLQLNENVDLRALHCRF